MTIRKNLGQCQIEGCTNPAKYGLNKTFADGIKKWLYVCPLHEKHIGDENMQRAGGYYSGRGK